ncbi:MAG: glycosyltransferase [Fibrobacter sp.]|nr:glycosyltransferase [Fibrobacter sp.]
MTFSIALATYNGTKFLREQLDSILSQSATDFEVIACDDCSTDKTLQILQEYASRDSRFKVYQNAKNLGFKKNFERILSLCKGEFIAFCDQDDIWEPDHLDVLYKNIGENDYIGANSLIIDEKDVSQNKTLLEYWPIHVMPQNEKELFQHELYSNVIQGTASLIRASLIKHALPIPEDIKYHDYWFALVAGLNEKCKYIGDVVLKYRRHSNNASEYQKFTIWNAIKNLYSFSKDRKGFYQDNISLLNNLARQEKLPSDKQKLISDALGFYTNLSENKNRLSALWFYIKNYNVITFSKKSIWQLFLYRCFGILFFGIKG